MSDAVVAVAVSGGRDSTALLHATARIARDLGLQVAALHVHHGLMPNADHWLAGLRSRCRRWRLAGLPVTLHHRRLDMGPAPGDSIEAWARRERYAALASMARKARASIVLLAHHRQDQAETFVLQALRGAGPRGLASMPASVERDGLRWVRPWLGHDVSAIEAYLRRHRLRHVDDESNRDPRFARSRLRQQVWPALEGAFPDAAGSLAAAAARAQEAAECLAELAVLDAQTCVQTPGRLQLAAWLRLSGARRLNLLRHWLHGCLGQGAPETLVRRLCREVGDGEGAARWPAPGGEVVLHRGALVWVARVAGCTAVPTDRGSRLDLSTPGVHAIAGWPGHIVVQATAADGVPAALLTDCEVRAREGSEQFQRTPRSTPRSLKKQFQAAAVPAHLRDVPLVYAGRQLVFVPGLGIDARVGRQGGDDLLTLAWLASSA